MPDVEVPESLEWDLNNLFELEIVKEYTMTKKGKTETEDSGKTPRAQSTERKKKTQAFNDIAANRAFVANLLNGEMALLDEIVHRV